MKEQFKITREVLFSSIVIRKVLIIENLTMHNAEGLLRSILCNVHLLIRLPVRNALHAEDVMFIEDIGDGRFPRSIISKKRRHG
jgi:hypothetical protein